MRTKVNVNVQNILNTYMNKSLIYGIRAQSISWGYQKCEKEHSKAMYTGTIDTGMQRQRKEEASLILQQETGSELDNIQVQVWNGSSWNLRSCVEVTVVGVVTQD